MFFADYLSIEDPNNCCFLGRTSQPKAQYYQMGVITASHVRRGSRASTSLGLKFVYEKFSHITQELTFFNFWSNLIFVSLEFWNDRIAYFVIVVAR